jgi:hypothetical protein
MKSLLATLLVSSLAYADSLPPGTYECKKLDTVVIHALPSKKPLKKKVVKKKQQSPVTVPCSPTTVEKVVEKTVVKEITREVPVEVTSEITVHSPAPTTWEVTQGKANVTWVERKPWYLLMGHAAVGVGARDPHFSGLLGLRATFPKVRLGAEAYSAFAFGGSVQGLVYPVLSEKMNWHLSLGVLGFGQKYLSTQDVPRTWDLTAGTGVEVKLDRHFSLAVDWRMSVPSPVFIAGHSSPIFVNGAQILGEGGKYLHVGHVLGNSFTQSHLLVGLLFH